jgi:hypothetical protein
MASAGRAIEIGSATDHVGETVTVTGLVLEKGDGTATLDDGTGRVRVGGSSAASAISALAPGDAVEVTGVVNRDDKGLLIEADPESIVDLPADRAAPIAEDTGGALATQRLAGISAAAATPVVPNAMPRGQSGAQFPPGGPAVLLLIAILLLAGAAAVATARSRLPWSTRGGPPEGN